MHAPNPPEPWMIEELERMRHVREWEADEQARLPLYPPAPLPPGPSAEPSTRSVVVIDLC